MVAVEYRPENRVPDLRLKNGLGDGDAAEDELSGCRNNNIVLSCLIYNRVFKLRTFCYILEDTVTINQVHHKHMTCTHIW